MDSLALAATVAAGVAAGAACVTVWQARRGGRDLHAASSTLRGVLGETRHLTELQQRAVEEQNAGTVQLEVSVRTLREVLNQATELVTLQRESLQELRNAADEQRQAVATARVQRQLDRLTVVGERVEDLWLAVEATRLDALQGRDTTHAIGAAMARLGHAVASTGGEPPLPQCALLTRGHAKGYAGNGVDVLPARSEVGGAIAAMRGD